MEGSVVLRRTLALAGLIGVVLLAGLYEQRISPAIVAARSPEADVAYWKDHVARNKNTAASRLRLGLALAKVGQRKEAREAYLAALALDPDYDGAAIGLYSVVKSMGDRDRALVELAHYANEHPLCAVCWQNLAADYLALRRLHDAEDAVEALLVSDFSGDSKMYGITSMRLEALVLAARVYAALGKFPRAIEHLEDAISHWPRDSRAYLLQAQVLMASAKPDAALVILDEAETRAAGDDGLRQQIERLRQRARQAGQSRR